MQKQKSFWDYSIYERDIVAVYMDDGTQLLTYSYDAWGNATIEDAYVSDGIDLNIAYARKNPFRYRGYYYDDTLQLYWLQTRYYDPAIGRFISPDDISYLGANGDLNSYNLYAYCSNNPVMYVDPSGHLWDTILDIFSIGWSLYDFIEEPSWENFGWLALDIGFAIVPFLTGSSLIRSASKLDDVAYIGKGINKFDNVYDSVVLGNNMDRVTNMAMDIGAAFYGGYGPLNALSAMDKIEDATSALKKAAKLDNVRFIIDKFNEGYNFIHIGSDGRGFFKMMKSAYGMELKILYRLKIGNKLHSAWWLLNSGRRVLW